jgi:hypothetical protein
MPKQGLGENTAEMNMASGSFGAGVQGYFAFLRRQRVIYLGRQGDQHVEWFPGAKPGDA